MHQQTVRLTEVDSRHLEILIAGLRPTVSRDADSIELLERHLDAAQVIPAKRIGPDVVTMNSEVQVRDLDTQQTVVFQLVFPRAANGAAGRVSVLAPLGMAVLGRRVGEVITWRTPGGLRRLQVGRLVYQPEREGKDVA